MKYANKNQFDPEFPTFDNVDLEAPPSRFDALTGDVIVDNHDTFGDIPENYDKNGNPRELPVPGYLAAQPSVEAEVIFSGESDGIAVDSKDTHLSGENLELLSSYKEGTLENAQFVSLDMVKSWVGSDDIIKPNRAFDRDSLIQWIVDYDPQGLGGYFVFRDHGLQDSPLYGIYPTVESALAMHPRRYSFKKGQRASKIIRGFVPQSYSCIEDSMGVSWGPRELLDANGVEVRRVLGTAIDFCPGLSAVHLAEDGKPVWVNVDSGGIIRAPIPGTPYTTEHMMLKSLLKYPNVHFYNTALEMKVHRALIRTLPKRLQRWAYGKADSI